MNILPEVTREIMFEENNKMKVFEVTFTLDDYDDQMYIWKTDVSGDCSEEVEIQAEEYAEDHEESIIQQYIDDCTYNNNSY